MDARAYFKNNDMLEDISVKTNNNAALTKWCIVELERVNIDTWFQNNIQIH